MRYYTPLRMAQPAPSLNRIDYAQLVFVLAGAALSIAGALTPWMLVSASSPLGTTTYSYGPIAASATVGGVTTVSSSLLSSTISAGGALLLIGFSKYPLSSSLSATLFKTQTQHTHLHVTQQSWGSFTLHFSPFTAAVLIRSQIL